MKIIYESNEEQERFEQHLQHHETNLQALFCFCDMIANASKLTNSSLLEQIKELSNMNDNQQIIIKELADEIDRKNQEIVEIKKQHSLNLKGQGEEHGRNCYALHFEYQNKLDNYKQKLKGILDEI